MQKLRDELPGAEVIKHADGSMIGLPDCSVTFNTHVAWIEFKFDFLDDKIEDLLDDTELLSIFLLNRHRKNAETQYEKVRSLGRQALGIYLFFVHKTCVVALDPNSMSCRKMKDATEAASFVGKIMRSWRAHDSPFDSYCS
jgi:hypothetical protein